VNASERSEHRHDSNPLEACYIDTSLIVAAVTAGIEHHSAANEFCQRLFRDGATVSFSELVRLEYLHALRQMVGSPNMLSAADKRKHGLQHWGNRRSVRANWLRHGVQQFESLVSQFTRAYEIRLTRGILDNATRIMSECNLDSYDATHVATTLQLGVTDLASIDEHFSRAARYIHPHIILQL
jgi:predicted nucleic acid-binding protein